MKNLLSVFALFFIAASLSAQPVIEWQKMLGGSNDEGFFGNDQLASSQQTSDGGFILAGYTKSNNGDVSGNHGNMDAWVVKIDSAGNLDWQRTYGGSNYDAAHCIHQTDDGGYIVGCISASNDGDVSGGHGLGDFWIVKINESGDMQWQKSLGGSSNEDLNAISQTSDGGYIAIGTTSSQNGDVSGFDNTINIWVVKLDETGAIEWEKVLGGSAQDTGMDIKQTNEGGYILTSFVASNNNFVSGNHGSFDYWIVKLSVSGEIEWRKAYGGTQFDVATCIQTTTDGGYIVAGGAQSTNGNVTGNHGASDYWIVKLNAFGVIEWQKAFGGSNYETAFAIQQTKDGGYIVGGWSNSTDGDVLENHGNNDYWILKINNLGELQWQKSLGGSKDDYADDITQTADGGYLVSGISKSNDGDVSGNHAANTFDYWVVKLGPEQVDVNDLPSNPIGYLEIFPNPANSTVSISILAEEISLEVSITDAQGRRISHQTIPNGGNLDTSNLVNGIYSILATTPSGLIFSNKLSVIH